MTKIMEIAPPKVIPRAMPREDVFSHFLAGDGCELTPEEKSAIAAPTLNCWKVTQNEVKMLSMLTEMFKFLNLQSKLGVPEAPLRNFLAHVYINYNDNPYHNFNHCFCVTQMMCSMLTASRSCGWLGPLEQYALMISALCHDLQHPGLTNDFQVKNKTKLAEKYSSSPLEHHHVDVAFSILNRPECNIISVLPPEDGAKVRQWIQDLILATDMDLHKTLLEQFRQTVSKFDPEDSGHKMAVMKIIIKACDLSNEARPRPVNYRWSDCLMEEFFVQGDMEKTRGFSPIVLMDRARADLVDGQVGFIRFVSLPVFTELARLIPLGDLVSNMQSNLDFYQSLKERRNSNCSVDNFLSALSADSHHLEQDSITVQNPPLPPELINPPSSSLHSSQHPSPLSTINPSTTPSTPSSLSNPTTPSTPSISTTPSLSSSQLQTQTTTTAPAAINPPSINNTSSPTHPLPNPTTLTLSPLSPPSTQSTQTLTHATTNTSPFSGTAAASSVDGGNVSATSAEANTSNASSSEVPAVQPNERKRLSINSCHTRGGSGNNGSPLPPSPLANNPDVSSDKSGRSESESESSTTPPLVGRIKSHRSTRPSNLSLPIVDTVENRSQSENTDADQPIERDIKAPVVSAIKSVELAGDKGSQQTAAATGKTPPDPDSISQSSEKFDSSATDLGLDSVTDFANSPLAANILALAQNRSAYETPVVAPISPRLSQSAPITWSAEEVSKAASAEFRRDRREQMEVLRQKSLTQLGQGKSAWGLRMFTSTGLSNGGGSPVVSFSTSPNSSSEFQKPFSSLHTPCVSPAGSVSGSAHASPSSERCVAAPAGAGGACGGGSNGSGSLSSGNISVGGGGENSGGPVRHSGSKRSICTELAKSMTLGLTKSSSLEDVGLDDTNSDGGSSKGGGDDGILRVVSVKRSVTFMKRTAEKLRSRSKGNSTGSQNGGSGGTSAAAAGQGGSASAVNMSAS